MSCIICGQKSDKHHVKTRKSGGCDNDFNLMNLCRKHHVETHAIGTTTFTEKYLEVREWMLKNGWQYNDVKKKWTRF